jgi:polyhydroxyalkanoate synthesis regulator phasin
MVEKTISIGHGQVDALILRALVRKLVAKGALSPDEVRAMLFDAAKHLDLVGGELTPEAARIVVEEDLAPAFLSDGT